MDWLLLFLPIMVAGFIAGRLNQAAPTGTANELLGAMVGRRGVAVAMSFNAVFAILAIQAFLIATMSQSIGKWLLHVKIARLDGRPPGFVRGFLVREFVSVAIVVVPFGIVVVIADYALAFNPDRRCLHDLVAGTHVVVASADENLIGKAG